MNKKYVAELLGTFALSLTVLLSVAGHFPIPTPLLAALTLGLFVYSIGHISGCHLNPAVTLGLLSVKKITAPEALAYIGTQFMGAIFAMALVRNLGIPNQIAADTTMAMGIAEALGTFFFTFGIASVVKGRAPSLMSGVLVGGSLLLGISIAANAGSTGVLNPAVALALFLFTPAYIIGPIVGSIIGFQTYQFFDQKM